MVKRLNHLILTFFRCFPHIFRALYGHGQRLFQPNAGEIVKSQYFRYLQISSDQTSGKRHVFPEPENFLRSHEETQDFLGLACFDWFPD
jgi:hypothetical protein